MRPRGWGPAGCSERAAACCPSWAGWPSPVPRGPRAKDTRLRPHHPPDEPQSAPNASETPKPKTEFLPTMTRNVAGKRPVSLQCLRYPVRFSGPSSTCGRQHGRSRAYGAPEPLDPPWSSSCHLPIHGRLHRKEQGRRACLLPPTSLSERGRGTPARQPCRQCLEQDALEDRSVWCQPGRQR